MNCRTFALALWLLLGVAQAAEPPEVTEDGLVRVPSNRKVGVYRAPDVPFARYRRIVIGDIPVQFQKDWERNNPQFKPSDRERMLGELVQMFRKVLVGELVEDGGYQLTDAKDPDVLRIEPSIIDLDITAPDAGSMPGTRTYIGSTGSMQLQVELRDAASGVLVGRIIDYEQAREYPEPQLANRTTINEDLRIMFANAARYTREALDVAKTRREP